MSVHLANWDYDRSYQNAMIAVSMNPKDERLKNNLEIIKQAITYTQNGKISEAKAIYDGLLAENPDDVNLLSVYGLFYVNIGNYDKACEILRKACGIKESFGTVSALGFAEYERI